jgi:hypothetical protein
LLMFYLGLPLLDSLQRRILLLLHFALNFVNRQKTDQITPLLFFLQSGSDFFFLDEASSFFDVLPEGIVVLITRHILVFMKMVI